MSDTVRPLQYRQCNTRRSSTTSERVSTEMFSTTSTAKSMIPSPIASVVPSPVPSAIYSPYDTQAGSSLPESQAQDSPVAAPTGSPVSSQYGTTASRTSSSGRTSSSSSSTDVPNGNSTIVQQARSDRSRPRTSVTSTGACRRRHTISLYDPNELRRRASMNQAAETGRPACYGLTRDARVASMQENGRVRVERERVNTSGCCVIL